ncbi:hypothetical protein GQ57_38495 [Burkholderia sp. MSh2]|nr:hypothetical protein GQ57_38495 [Burkholderia sp. MSh2]
MAGPQDRTAREQTLVALAEIFKVHGVERTEKEFGTSLNALRNGTKHHDANDSETIVADVESVAWDAILRAVDNYGRYTNTLSERMIEFVRHGPDTSSE